MAIFIFDSYSDKSLQGKFNFNLKPKTPSIDLSLNKPADNYSSSAESISLAEVEEQKSLPKILSPESDFERGSGVLEVNINSSQLKTQTASANQLISSLLKFDLTASDQNLTLTEISLTAWLDLGDGLYHRGQDEDQFISQLITAPCLHFDTSIICGHINDKTGQLLFPNLSINLTANSPKTITVSGFARNNLAKSFKVAFDLEGTNSLITDPQTRPKYPNASPNLNSSLDYYTNIN